MRTRRTVVRKDEQRSMARRARCYQVHSATVSHPTVVPGDPTHRLRHWPARRTLARSTAGSRVWHYNYFRSYSAERGRYTQADPIGLDGGFNRFGYVEGNALSFSDSKGLSIEDANYILGQMLRSFSDVRPNGYLYLGSVPEGISGQTTNLTGNIRISTSYAAKRCLPQTEWEALFWTLFHEGMHSTDPWYRRWMTENKSSDKHHNGIYRRESYERMRPKFATLPMWGTPRPTAVDTDALYQQYKQNSPDCICTR